MVTISLLLPKQGSSDVKMCTRCLLEETLWPTCRFRRLTAPLSGCFVSFINLNEAAHVSVGGHHRDFYRSLCLYHLRLCCETSPLEAKTQETLIFPSKTEVRRSLLCPATPRYSLNPPLERPFASQEIELNQRNSYGWAKVALLGNEMVL